MKKTSLFLTLIGLLSVAACKKNNSDAGVPSSLPRTSVPAELQGNWMYGNFSMTEYWSQDPSGYIGNALEFAIAFTFDANGNCEQYFTSGSSASGVTTYQQSVTKGTVEVDPGGKTIKTHPFKAHYKRTRNGQTVEERDMTGNELSAATTYTYTIGVEPSGKKAIYLMLPGTAAPLTFVKK
jgi:hypothetical protein